jgi:hypothetical protein
MTAADVDSYLTLEDASGVPLRRDDNSYGQRDAMIVHYLPAGTYRLAASSMGQTAGLYRIDVLYLAGERPSGCDARRTLTAGDRVEGMIHIHGCQYSDNTFADVYRIEVAETVERTIEMEAARYEPQLLLMDAPGNLLEKRPGRIERALESGIYFLVAKPAEDYSSVGAYTLTMR